MDYKKLNELYEEAERIKADKANVQKIYIGSLDKLITVCRQELLPKPERKWFKKVCPCCGLKLNKRIRTTLDSPCSYWRYTHYACVSCDYEWADRRYHLI